ncbi:hypothetical protein [Bacillus cereus]|uniref:hypothetical protein n=1 Tax=Bacillus cereus TaxID=1396 RepID=UPI003CFF4B6B
MVEKKESVKPLIIESVLSAISSQGAEAIKSTGVGVAGSIITDVAASFLPGVGNAYMSYKQSRLQRNFNTFEEQLTERVTRLAEIFDLKNLEQRQELDRLYELVLGYVEDEPQEEKIQYLVTGFMNIAEHEKIKEDFVLVFYDTLKDLRVIDLTVLKLYGRNYLGDSNVTVNDYQDVLEMHGISYEQYETIRKNLVRKGMLTTKTDIILEKDLETIEKAINELQKFVSMATNPKNKSRLPSLKKLQIKSKDRLELTKFGKDFIRYFLEELTQ